MVNATSPSPRPNGRDIPPREAGLGDELPPDGRREPNPLEDDEVDPSERIMAIRRRVLSTAFVLAKVGLHEPASSIRSNMDLLKRVADDLREEGR